LIIDNEKTQPSPPPRSTPSRGVPDLRTRRLLDERGREWRVREVPPSAYDRRSACCLIFETTDVARRARAYPSNWYEQSDEFLLDLCEHPMGRATSD
jgi:hypothetical protein